RRVRCNRTQSTLRFCKRLNGKELERGLRALDRARERLQRIEAYLKAVTTLVTTVAKVVKP
ncbi:MAG: hypothetical protein OXN22_07865, partial [Deltaproteobacteria bacterium]|nr:hypothetical protein [Deltaproteobacteria bacterium]